MGKGSPRQVRRSLPDRQVQSFDKRSVESRGVLGIGECLFEFRSRPDHPPPLDPDHPMVPTSLEDLTVETQWPEDSTDDVLVEFESIGHDQEVTVQFHATPSVSNQGERIAVASAPDDCRRPQARPNVDRRKDPDRLLFAAGDRANLVGLELSNIEPTDRLVVESSTPRRCSLEPTVDCIPGESLDAGDRRLVHPFDAEGGDLVESAASMLEPVVRCALR